MDIYDKYQWVINRFKQKLPGCSVNTEIGQYGTSFSLSVSYNGKTKFFTCEALKTVSGTPCKNIDDDTGEEFDDIGPPYKNVQIGLPCNDDRFKVVDDWIKQFD